MKFASAKKRVFAKLIDLAVIVFLGLAWKGGAGSVLGFLYALMADGLPFQSWKGQSLGKKILSIQVIQAEPNANPMKVSVLRNLSMAVIALLMAIPFMGWLLAVMIGVPVAFVETSLIIRAEKHQRLGDVMAESYVIET